MIRDIPKITEIRGSDRTLTFLKSGLFNMFYKVVLLINEICRICKTSYVERSSYILDNGYETVSDDSHANLYSDSVLSGSLKNLYLEVLLQPFEAQFD